MTCKDFDSQIERYLGGELYEEEQEAFELHYFECDECFSRLKIVERLLSKEVHIVAGSAKPAFQLWWLLNWKPATTLASLLVVVFLSIWLITSSAHMKYLYQVSDVPPPAYITMETRGNLDLPAQDTQLQFSQAMAYYNQKNYSQALLLLDQIQVEKPNMQITFFQGICALYTHQLQNAVDRFERIITMMDPSYYDEAIYYKAIALLRLDKKSQAMTLLQNLAEMFSPYSMKAKELMAKLNAQ